MKVAGIIHAQNRANEIMSSLSFRVEQVFRDSHQKQLSENGWLMVRRTVTAPIASATKPGAIEGADRRDYAQNRRSVDGAFESGERLTKPVVHHPKEGVHNLTDGAPRNLSNAH